MNGVPRWRTWVCGAVALMAASCGGASNSASPTETAEPVEPPVVGVIDTQPLPQLPPPDTQPVESTVPPTTVDTTSCINTWPLRARIGQLVWPASYGDRLERDAEVFAEWGVGGAVVMTFPELATADQLATLKDAGSIPLVLAANEEGGLVQPFARVHKLAAASGVVKLASVDDAKQLIAEHAEFIADLGIDMVFAPVVDLSPERGEGPLSVRTFSDDVLIAAAYARSYIEAWREAGVTPVVKHFPGQGSADEDPHVRAATSPPFDELRSRDLLVYDDLRILEVDVMVGHLDVPGLTDGGPPASLNQHAITDVLRGEYGFADALVITDALGMGAIAGRYSVPVAAELALIAGADVVQFTNTDETPAVIDALVEAAEAGRLRENRIADAVGRVLVAKGVDPCLVTFD